MILVTGHKGFIGSKLYSKLKSKGFDVIGIDLKDGLDILHNLPNNLKIDYVFHLAALPRVEFSGLNPSYTMLHNVLATSKLLEWCVKNNVKRFILSSSSAVYGNGDGNPESPYGLHKKINEQECELYSKIYGLDTVCLRYFNVYSEDQPFDGSYSTVISSWMYKIANNEPLIINGDGSNKRDYVHVEDVVSANLFAMNYNDNFNGDKFDVGTGKNYSINYIKEYINFVFKNKINFINNKPRKGDPHSTLADVSKLLNIGWKSNISFDDGLSKCFKA